MRVSVEAIGDVNDVGLQLFDCAGWSVDQWHAQGGDVRADALGNLDRVRTWMHDRPLLAANVFGRGIAYDPAAPRATYFFTLFKTNDGYMRALVRPGGPAWVAGLRTGDVVDKVDGRFWWEYGTYQTQLRAYDGKPHTFDITRGEQHDVHIALGEPYRG
jgi:predicted metalloprotease with PDZ domain